MTALNAVYLLRLLLQGNEVPPGIEDPTADPSTSVRLLLISVDSSITSNSWELVGFALTSSLGEAVAPRRDVARRGPEATR